VLPRPRLFERLDGIAPASAVWVSGPAGAGKTTLLASWIGEREFPALWYQIDAGDGDPATFFHYLSQAASRFSPKNAAEFPQFFPEYLPGLDTFARRFFEALFGRLPPTAVLVLDNFQEAPSPSPLAGILCRAIDTAPPGVTLVILGRGHPPAILSRCFANRRAVFIDGDFLQFSLEECQRLIPLFLNAPLSEAQIREVHRRTRGWAAGIALWLLKNGTGVGGFYPEAETPPRVFAYFAAEILGHAPGETREFLLQTAFLSEMTGESAAAICGKPQSAGILETLHRQNFFLDRRDGAPPRYQFHPLFRDFLLHRARRALTLEEYNERLARAGDILAEEGLIDGAAKAYRETGAHLRLSALIRSHAEGLRYQGRYATLAEWTESLPEPLVRGNPWLVYWRGVARTASNPDAARTDGEAAFLAFKKSGDVEGQIFCFQMVTETFFQLQGDARELDRWIEAGDRLGDRPEVWAEPALAARLTAGMLCALMFRAPGHPSAAKWMDRGMAAWNETGPPGFQLMVGSFLMLLSCWRGDMHRAGLLADRLAPLAERADIPPTVLVTFRSAQCGFLFHGGDPAPLLEATRVSLELSRRVGFFGYDHIFRVCGFSAALAMADFSMAEELLDGLASEMSPDAWIQMSLFHAARALKAYVLDRPAQGLAEIEMALEIDEKRGTPGITVWIHRLIQLRLWGEAGEIDRALAAAETLLDLARDHQFALMEFHLFLILADLHGRSGNPGEVHANLEKAFELSRQNGIMDGLHWRRSRLSELCQEALAGDIETDQVIRFIHRNRLRPAAPLLAGPEWPWAVKIRVLGGFQMEIRADDSGPASRKAKRPMELLALMICRGPGGISREEAADALWPDTDGDRVRQNLDTTLFRLRRMLGTEFAVEAADGRLALAPAVCWVDAWHFDERMKRADREADVDRKRRLLERALAFYPGPVAAEIRGIPLCLAFSGWISAQWRHGVLALSALLEKDGQVGAAIEVCMRALSREETSEPLYLALMTLLANHGRTSEALGVYRRCRNVLSRRLGLAPGPEMKRLRERIEGRRG
jgi:DNA-binding SARP family transcriptional activator